MIVVVPSLLMRKYVGDSSQMLKALFSLAAKLQPCILFVDEIDALMKARHDDEHSVDRYIKIECKHVSYLKIIILQLVNSLNLC